MFKPTTTAIAGLLMLAACGGEPAKASHSTPPAEQAAERELTLTYFNIQG